MLPLGNSLRIFVASEAIDGRKGLRGLSELVLPLFEQDPQKGHLFVFFSKGNDVLRVLMWDRNGFCLLSKRLEKGRFAHRIVRLLGGPRYEISRDTLTMLLAGLAPLCEQFCPV